MEKSECFRGGNSKWKEDVMSAAFGMQYLSQNFVLFSLLWEMLGGLHQIFLKVMHQSMAGGV